MHSFKLVGGKIIDRGVAPLAVVPGLDEHEDRCLRFGSDPESMPIDQLRFECGEEALAHRVVVAVADRSGGGTNPVSSTTAAEFNRGVLSSLIRVMNDALRWSSLLERHLQCRRDQLGSQVILHRPADDPSTPGIEHHCQVEKAVRGGRNIGDVGHPKLIRTRGCEVTVDQIGGRPCRPIAHRRLHPFTPTHCGQPALSH